MAMDVNIINKHEVEDPDVLYSEFVLRDTLKVLAESGFLAVFVGCIPAAESIFGLLRRFCPEEEFPLLGLGLAAIADGRPEEAISLLERSSAPEAAALQCLAHISSQSYEQASRMAEQFNSEGGGGAIGKLYSALRTDVQRHISPTSAYWTRNDPNKLPA